MSGFRDLVKVRSPLALTRHPRTERHAKVTKPHALMQVSVVCWAVPVIQRELERLAADAQSHLQAVQITESLLAVIASPSAVDMEGTIAAQDLVDYAASVAMEASIAMASVTWCEQSFF